MVAAVVVVVVEIKVVVVEIKVVVVEIKVVVVMNLIVRAHERYLARRHKMGGSAGQSYTSLKYLH
jgi:hypothetical protein